jgi:hypothetical protein
MPLQAPRVQGRTLKRPFDESVRYGRKPKRATEGGARGSPLGKKNPPRDLLVKNGIIIFGTDLASEVKILGETWKKSLRKILSLRTINESWDLTGLLRQEIHNTHRVRTEQKKRDDKTVIPYSKLASHAMGVYTKSNRSAFITLVQAFTKSLTNLSFASS